MAGKNKTKSAKNLSKKRNKANKKAKAAAVNNLANTMTGDVGITQEELDAAGEDMDNATLYSDSVDLSDTSEDDLGRLEAEIEKDKMTAPEKAKQTKNETGSKSSYPAVCAAFATDDFSVGTQKYSYPRLAANHATDDFTDGTQRSSYPRLAANHASLIVGLKGGSMGPPPRRASLDLQITAAVDVFKQLDTNGTTDVPDMLGIYNDVPGYRPLPKIPVTSEDDDDSRVKATESFDNMVDEQIKRSLDILKEKPRDADINAFALMKTKLMEEGQIQEAEYDPASFDVNSVTLKDMQRDNAFFGDKMDYVMANDQENDTSANSGDNKLTPTTSEDDAPHNLIVECANKKAADAIGGRLIEAAEDEDVTTAITNVSIVSATQNPAIGEGDSFADVPTSDIISQLPLHDQLGLLQSLYTNALEANAAGLPKPGQGSVPIDPVTGQTLAAVLSGMIAKDLSKKDKENELARGGDANWIDQVMKSHKSDQTERGKVFSASGGPDTLVAINGEAIDLDEAVPKPKSKKRKRPNKNKNKNAVTENVSASASGHDDTIMTGDAADVSNNDESEFGFPQMAKAMADAAVKFVTSDTEKPSTLLEMRDDMQKELEQLEFMQRCALVGEGDVSTNPEDHALSSDDDNAIADPALNTFGANLSDVIEAAKKDDLTAFVTSNKQALPPFASVDTATIDAEVKELLAAFTPEVCQNLALDTGMLDSTCLAMGRAMFHIAAHGRPVEGEFFRKALRVTQEYAASDLTDEEVMAKESEISIVLSFYAAMKHGKTDDKEFHKQLQAHLTPLLAPLSNEILLIQKVNQELSGKCGISSKLISNTNRQVQDLVFDLKTFQNEFIRFKEAGGGQAMSGDESAVGFMADSCHTFTEDFKNIRDLIDDRCDTANTCMKALEDAFKNHVKEHHGSRHKISDVLIEMYRVKDVVQTQMNVVCKDMDSLRQRGNYLDDKIKFLTNSIQRARLEAVGSGGDGAALGKINELEGAVERLAVIIGTVNRTFMEFRISAETKLAKHDKAIGTIRTDIVGLHKTTKDIKTTVEDHSEKITAFQVANALIAHRATETNTKVDAAINTMNNSNRKFDRSIAEQNTIRNTLEKNGKEIGTLSKAVENLQVKQADQHEKLNSNIQKHGTRIGNCEKKLSVYDEKINTANNRVDTATEQIIKLHTAFERELGAVEVESGKNGKLNKTKSLHERLMIITQASAAHEAKQVVKKEVAELDKRISELETAVAAKPTLNHAIVQTDLPVAIAPTSVNDAIPATPHVAGPRVRLPQLDRVANEIVAATPGAQSPAPMIPHPTPPGPANMMPQMMSLALPLPSIPEDAVLNAVSMPFESPAMERAMLAPAGAFTAPNGGPGGPPAHVAPMPGMLNGLQGPFPLGDNPGESYPPFSNGPGAPPGFGGGFDPIRRELNDHFHIMSCMGDHLSALGKRISPLEKSFSEIQDAIHYFPDQVRQVKQDARYEIGKEQARMKQEMDERFRHLSLEFGHRLAILEDGMGRRDKELVRLEGVVGEIMRFVGMPPPAAGVQKRSLEHMVIDIMNFVGMRKSDGFGN